MPTYDFRCETCGHEFEMTSSIAERDDKALCPECGSHQVQTIIKTFSIGSLHRGATGPLGPRLASGALQAAAKP